MAAYDRSTLRLEPLEDRIAPAGSVAVKQAGGNLTITGDDAANSIILDADGLAAGQLRISAGADGSTDINGSSDPLILSGVTGNIKVSLKGGDDVIDIAGAALPRALSIDMGSGADTVGMGGGAAVAGALSVKASGDLLMEVAVAVDGDVKIQKTGIGLGIITLIGAFGEDVTFAGASGDDAFGISTATVAGNVSINGAKGTLLTGFIDATVGGSFKAVSGGGHVLNADHLSVAGATALSAAGETGMQFDNCRFSGAFSTKNGKSEDALLVNGTTFGRGVSISNGAGGSTTDFFQSAIGADDPGGRGVDFKFSAGEGVDLFEITDGPVTVGSVSINAGAGNAAIWLEGADVSRNLAVKGAGGLDEIMVAQCIVAGKTSVDAGAGDDNVSFDGVHLIGPLSVKGGAGLDDIWLDAGDDPAGPTSIFDRAVSIDGGSGNDAIFLGTAGEAGNSAVYNSTLLLNGGSGDDQADLFNNGNVFAFEPLPKAVENVA